MSDTLSMTYYVVLTDKEIWAMNALVFLLCFQLSRNPLFVKESIGMLSKLILENKSLVAYNARREGFLYLRFIFLFSPNSDSLNNMHRAWSSKGWVQSLEAIFWKVVGWELKQNQFLRQNVEIKLKSQDSETIGLETLPSRWYPVVDSHESPKKSRNKFVCFRLV